MNWLKQPYYTPVPDLRQDDQSSGSSKALGVEGACQAEIVSSLSSVDSWLDPTYYNPWANVGKSLDEFADGFMWDINFRLKYYPWMAVGLDPVSMAGKYAKIFVNTLKQIDSGGMTGGTEGKSVWDAWVALKP